MYLTYITLLTLLTSLASAAAHIPRDGGTPTTLTAAAAINAVATPSPTQPGMTSNCDSFHLVSSTDTCVTIASSAGITLANFYSWNPGVGSDCDTLWLGYYVCTGVSDTTTTTTISTTTTSTTTSVTTPLPTQSGMVSNCDAFYLVASGDTCTTVAQKKSVSVTDIIAWNPAVGTGCTNLWLGYYICVGVL